MIPYWVTFENRDAACIEVPVDAKYVHEICSQYGKVKEIKALPYPAEPRLGVKSDWPSFCSTPAKCAGKNCCLKEFACND